MTGKQAFVVFVGLVLVALNLWASPRQRSSFGGLIGAAPSPTGTGGQVPADPYGIWKLPKPGATFDRPNG